MNVKPSARSLSCLLTLALCLTMSTTGCDNSTAKSATAEAGTAKSEVKQPAANASADDCPTFTKELIEVCHGVLDRKAAGPCGKGIHAIIEIREAHGEAFMSTAGACQAALDDFRESLTRATTPGVDEPDWHESCPDTFANLKTACFDKITTGTPASECPSRMLSLEMDARNQRNGSMVCRMELIK